MSFTASLCGQAVQDLQENNEYWDQYEGKVAEVSNQVNDTYLKLNDQKDGVQSYGRVVVPDAGYVPTKSSRSAII